MPSIALASYTIRVRKAREKEHLTLGSFDGHQDLLNVIEAYLKNRVTSPSKNDNSKKYLRVDKCNSNGRELFGSISTGEWGYESLIQNVETGRKTHQKTTEEAEMIPFYFLVSIPKKSDEGILIFQRFGNKGIRKMFLDDLNGVFGQFYPEYRLEINPLAPGKLIEQYLGGTGRVTQIRLIQFKLPDDLSDQFANVDHQEIYIEYVIKARRNRSIPFLSKLRDTLEGRSPLSKLVEVKNIEPDVVKVEIEVNKKSRVIDLSDRSTIRAYYDVTKDVTLIKGQPEFHSIHAVASELLSDLRKDLRGKQA